METKASNNNTIIIRHACKATGPGAEFQDKTYGVNHRVCNKTKKGDVNAPKFRCTLCGELITN